MLFPHLLLILRLEEVVAGNSQGRHQHDKLVEIHLVVLVGIQVVHDFLHQHRILLGLQTKRENKARHTTFAHRTSTTESKVQRGYGLKWHVLLMLRLNTDSEAAESRQMLLLNEPRDAAHHTWRVLLCSFPSGLTYKRRFPHPPSCLFLTDIWIFLSRVFALVRA